MIKYKHTLNHIVSHSLENVCPSGWDIPRADPKVSHKGTPFTFTLDDGSVHQSTPGHHTHVMKDGVPLSVPIWLAIAQDLPLIIPR